MRRRIPGNLQAVPRGCLAMARAPAALLALLFLSLGAPPAAADPYVQTYDYVLGYGCCTFAFEEGDTSVRIVVLDAVNAVVPVAASADIHTDNHGLLRRVFLCGDSGDIPIPAGAAHFHFYLLDAASALALCGPASPQLTVGTVQARMNGA